MGKGLRRGERELREMREVRKEREMRKGLKRGK